MDCNEEGESEDVSNQEEEVQQEGEKPVISLNAMEGVQEKEQQTMRLKGTCKKRSLHLLVETGSTYNVLDIKVAKELGWPFKQITPIEIVVANGQKIYCQLFVKD